MPSATERALPTAAALPLRPREAVRPRLAASVSQLLASQVALGVVGLASLPILARNLGPGAYGRFSLFVTLLGVLAQVDFARPILVRELSGAGGAAAERRGLAGASACLLAPLGLALGWTVLGPLAAAGLALCALLHAAASEPYAALAARGRVGLGGAVRNAAWAAAMAASAGLSLVTPDAHAFVWSFVVANAAILFHHRRATGARGALLAAPRLDALRAHRRAGLDLLLFSAANALVVSLDRLLLARTAAPEVLGQYVAQMDLAIKVHILSTALGAALYPLLARLHAERGARHAARHFVRFASWSALGAFALCLGLMLAGDRLLFFVLGPGFRGSFDAYHVILVGVFVHVFGFLITPWQRARGDFATHRRAYVGAALLMLALGPVLVPALGARGALLTYLCGRSAELALLVHELRRLPRAVLPRGRVAVLAGMVLVLAALAARAVLRGGGAA